MAVAAALAAPAEVAADDEPAVEPPATVTFTKREKKGGVTEQALISCQVSIDYPHRSTHNPGRANVVSRISCSHFMSSLSLETKLWRAGYVVGTGFHSITGWFALNGNASAPCLSASYQGSAFARVVAPPGYTPSIGTTTVWSPVRWVTC
ncbi:MAG TPA: hypothetical protein VML35_09390 [Gaiellaceae bacterium]|nr:hypothetical protein [Gaiellaceae bacterium]